MLTLLAIVPLLVFVTFGILWLTVPPDHQTLRIAGLSAPVRLVRGGTSPFVTDEDADELAGRARQFQGIQIVENSGHSVQSDQPRVLIDILRGVLAG